MKIDILTFHYDNVGKLYGPYQADWFEQKGYKTNRFSINNWKKNIKIINDTDSEIFLAWGVDQHTIGDFFGNLKNFNRDKYKIVGLFTMEPVYTRFGFYRNPKQNSATQHDRFIREVKPNLLCYACKEDYYLSKCEHKLWICQNKYRATNVIPWSQKDNTIIFAGKNGGWEDYQYPSYKGHGRSKQIQIIKKALGNRIVCYGPNTFNMDEGSLPFYNKHRYSLCPRAGHILHPRVSVACQVNSIPIITIPDDCPEMKWLPEIKHGHNCFVIKDSQLANIGKIISSGSQEMADNVKELVANHNFESSMVDIDNKLRELL